MKIRVKLYASLAEYLPPGTKGNETEVEVRDGATLLSVMADMKLPQEMCHLVLVNGVYIEPSQRDGDPLSDGDTIAIWPPVAGG